eukprot:TRINITY_DN53347_c0_g1_i1.p1 TRINITY_DN53347_c0_g1~~TRINITY_DN53347_c0_g1_i1.p1  ORF type:complete len:304 (+),score=29.95 TRINITY_DN53347_c0_g1_i1:99-914(+)
MAENVVLIEVSGCGLAVANGTYRRATSGPDGEVYFAKEARNSRDSDALWSIRREMSSGNWAVCNPTGERLYCVQKRLAAGVWERNYKNFPGDPPKSPAPSPTIVLRRSSHKRASTPSLQERMWKKRKFTDAVVTCGTARFDVHRAALAAASHVFEAAFESSMREGRTAEYEIKDSTPAAVEAFLHFIYTGKIVAGLADNDLTSMLDLAIMYEVEEMVSPIARNLVECLTEDNVMARARALNLHKDKAQEQWQKLLDTLQSDRKLLAATLPC